MDDQGDTSSGPPDIASWGTAPFDDCRDRHESRPTTALQSIQVAIPQRAAR